MEPTPNQHTRRRRTVIMKASSTEVMSKRETSARRAPEGGCARRRGGRETSTLARAPTTRLPERAIERRSAALHANDGADHLAREVTGAARLVDAHRAQEAVE